MTITYTVCIDWDADGSFATAGDDITAYVNSVRSRSGFGEEIYNSLERIAPIGTCTLELDNRDKRFSPLYASGPYYGKLLPGKPIRIQATVGGTPPTVWRGYTKSWKPEPGFTGRAILECEDVMSIFQRTRIALPLQTDKTMSEMLLLIGSEVFKTGVASGTVAISFQPAENDTVTVGTITYRFKTTPAQAYDVYRTADPARNLAAAINLSDRVVDGVTLYHANTQRHPSVNATLDAPSWGTGTSNGYWDLGRTGFDYKATAHLMERNGIADHVWINLQIAGTPDTLTITMVKANGAAPGSTLVDANATVTVSAASLSSGWNKINFPGSFNYSGTDWLKITYNGAEHASNYYRISRQYQIVFPGYNQTMQYGGAWTAYGYDYDLDFWLPGSLTLAATARGAWGNAISLAKSGTNITVSGATLSGGVDGPPLRDYQTGQTTFPFVGDLWSEAETNAMTAVTDVIVSEPGLLWVARDGTVTAKDRDWLNAQAAATAQVLNGTHFDQVGVLDDTRLANHIIVSFTPRGQETNQVIARSNSVITVPGSTSGARWTRSGSCTVRLPFIVPESGTVTGAKDVIHPAAGTDYTVYDTPSTGGFNYTTSGRITISMVILGSGVELTFENTATGPLYVRNLQIRGTRLILYDAQEVIREDATSITTYGRRTLAVDMPLIADRNLAEAYANFLLGQYKDPLYIISSVDLYEVDRSGVLSSGDHPLSIEIGTVLSISETQTAVSGAKYLVQGIETVLGAETCQIVWYVRTLGAQTYWILGHATYGVLGSTTRLGI